MCHRIQHSLGRWGLMSGMIRVDNPCRSPSLIPGLNPLIILLTCLLWWFIPARTEAKATKHEPITTWISLFIRNVSARFWLKVMQDIINMMAMPSSSTTGCSIDAERFQTHHLLISSLLFRSLRSINTFIPSERTWTPITSLMKLARSLSKHRHPCSCSPDSTYTWQAWTM